MPAAQPNRRTAMFLPALEPERLDHAVAAGVDMVCFDLEDGTAAARKDEARAGVRAAFEAPGGRPPLRYLRINHPASVAGVRDLAALLDWPTPPDGLVLPKIESAAEVGWVRASIGDVHAGVELMPIVETPAGLENAPAIAAAPGVVGLLLGIDDLSGALGSDQAWDSLAYARGRIVAAAAGAGVEAMDGPWRDPNDQAGLVAETRRVAAMGFTGKASYHSDQVPHIHAAFTPDAAAIRDAEAILAAARQDATGLTRVDGRIVNAAIVKQAERAAGYRPAARRPLGLFGEFRMDGEQ